MARWRRRLAVIVTAVGEMAVLSSCGLFGVGARPMVKAGEVTSGAAEAVPAQPVIRETKIERVLPASAPIPVAEARQPQHGPGAPQTATEPYRLGVDDELEISVYGEPDLSKTQAVRPDGKVVFPLVGDITAAGLTPEELREQLTQAMSRYIWSPRITVVMRRYASRKVSVLGELRTPGVLSLSSDISLVEAVSRAGGPTENADLLGGVLLRNGQVVPVDFDKLLRQGDASQNVALKANDVILIPDIRNRKAFVLGQVKKPGVVSLKPGATLVEAISLAEGATENADLPGSVLVRDGQILPVNFEKLLRDGDVSHNVLLKVNDVILVPDIKYKRVLVLGEVSRPGVIHLRTEVTLLESIAMAGGFTADAKKKTVLVMKGGFANTRVLTVNVSALTQPGAGAENVRLEPGDIVVVPRTIVADVVKFFQNLSTVLTPFVLAMTGIALGPTVEAVLTGKPATVSPSVSVPTQ